VRFLDLDTVGVGQAGGGGVGEDEDPAAKVRSTHVGRCQAVPLRVIPEAGQGPENRRHASVSAKQPWNVLQQHQAGS